MLPHGRASCFAGFASFQGRHLVSGGALVEGKQGVERAWWLRAGVAAARLRSADFASHRQRLASGLPHGLVLAPGAQGGLCGGSVIGERL